LFFRVTVGKFEASDPGVVRFDIYETSFQLSSDIWDQVTKMFNVDQDLTMPCDETREIVITFGEMELRLDPEFYMWQEAVPDYCYFIAGSGSKLYSF
jgi:hypothetical protein